MGDAVEVGVRMWTPKDIMDWPPPECERVPVGGEGVETSDQMVD